MSSLILKKVGTNRDERVLMQIQLVPTARNMLTHPQNLTRIFAVWQVYQVPSVIGVLLTKTPPKKSQ